MNTPSLPADVDETELSQQLRDRLAQFAHILSIKIIHDAKGGVCAFLQCEVSSSHHLLLDVPWVYAESINKLPSEGR